MLAHRRAWRPSVAGVVSTAIAAGSGGALLGSAAGGPYWAAVGALVGASIPAFHGKRLRAVSRSQTSELESDLRAARRELLASTLRHLAYGNSTVTWSANTELDRKVARIMRELDDARQVAERLSSSVEREDGSPVEKEGNDE